MREDIKIISVDYSELICPICYQIFQKPVKTSCGHNFCIRCIAQWTNKTKQCPCCRKNYSNEPFYQPDKTISEKVDNLEIICLKCNKWNGIIKELKNHRFDQCMPFQSENQSIQYEVVEDDQEERIKKIMKELLSIINQQNYINLLQIEEENVFQQEIPNRQNKINKNRKKKVNIKKQNQEDQEVQFLQEDDIFELKQSKNYITKQIHKRFKLQNKFLKEINEKNYQPEIKYFFSSIIYYRNLFLLHQFSTMQS